jgi:MFS family permease
MFSPLVDIRKLRQFLLVEGVLSAATYLAGSFVLIFLLRRGLGYEEGALFYVIFAISAVGALFLMTNRTVRRPRIWMATGMLILALSYGIFLILPPSWVLILAPIPFGAYIPLYWVPFNKLYMELTKKTNRGMATGIMYLIFPLIGVIFPVVGGASIEALGYAAIFLFAVLFLSANAVLIALLPAFKPQVVRNEIIIDRMGKDLSLGFLFEGTQEGIFFITLPLFTFEFAKGELGLGGLLALFALGGALASIVIGRLSDIKGRRGMFARVGALVAGPLIVLSAVMQDLLSYAVVMGVMNFALPIMWLMLLAFSIDVAEKEKGGAMFTREVLLNGGRLIGACVAFCLIFLVDIRITHALAGIFILLIAFIPLKRGKKTRP